jgi:hypothetical protein
MEATDDSDRRVWAAMLFATGHADIFGRCAAARGCTGTLTARAWRPKLGPRRWAPGRSIGQRSKTGSR